MHRFLVGVAEGFVMACTLLVTCLGLGITTLSALFLIPVLIMVPTLLAEAFALEVLWNGVVATPLIAPGLTYVGAFGVVTLLRFLRLCVFCYAPDRRDHKLHVVVAGGTIIPLAMVLMYWIVSYFLG